MISSPLRTIALCAACAVLAGAGSAALAADDGSDGPTVVTMPGKPVDGKLRMHKCTITAAKDGDVPDEVCTSEAGAPPPDLKGATGAEGICSGFAIDIGPLDERKLEAARAEKLASKADN